MIAVNAGTSPNPNATGQAGSAPTRSRPRSRDLGDPSRHAKDNSGGATASQGWTYGQTMAPDDPVYLSATTACLSAIIVMQIVNVFLCRSTVRSVASTGIFDNRLILWGVCLEIVLLMAINYTPFGNFLLGTAPVPGQLWLFMVPFAVAMLGLEETRKWLVRRTLQHGAQMRQLWTA